MKKRLLFFVCLLGSADSVHAQAVADRSTYLAPITAELAKVWPKNRTVNLVFHGHSVPAGYWHDHEVHTADSYPALVLAALRRKFPYAVINGIVTAIGGENSPRGAERIGTVLDQHPDVLFIDYALNDRRAGLAEAERAWKRMIEAALARGVRVILLTPSPDQREPLVDVGVPLEQHAAQIRRLAAAYGVGLVDSYQRFRAVAGLDLAAYMSHVNHPNRRGHELITAEVLPWFGL